MLNVKLPTDFTINVAHLTEMQIVAESARNQELLNHVM